MSGSTPERTLIISNVPWDFVWQRHQTLASLFARDGEVVYCELPGVRAPNWRDLPRIWSRLKTLRRGRGRSSAASSSADAAANAVPDRVTIVRPFVVPATNPLFTRINANRLSRFVSETPALQQPFDTVIDYTAWRTGLQLLDRVSYRRLIYDCTDDWLSVKGVPSYVAEDEPRLLRRADLTLVPSRRLDEMKRPHARRLVRLPHGAMVERFLMPPAAFSSALTVLYYGHLHRQHLDFAALHALALARPTWRLQLIGPVRTPHGFPPNVELPGQQRHEELRRWIEGAQVLLLPYVVNEYTRSVMPAKIYECLATGRPIVAAPLPELQADFAAELTFASAANEWPAAIEQSLRQDTPAKRAARVERAQANDWQSRYRQIRTLLAEIDAGSVR